MSRWLSVVGLGEDGLDGLSPAARVLVGSADVLVGGKRHLALVPDGAGERLTWPTPLVDLLPEIERRRGRRVCVLATGDPLCHGVAKTLLRAFSRDDMEILPAPSAFSLACARMCWSLPECETLTLHGRPLALLVPSLQPGARVLLLSNDGGTAAKVAALLRDRGFGGSRMTVLEHMGGPEERRIEAPASDWDDTPRADLNTIAIDCEAGSGAVYYPTLAGLPDEAFDHDGQITKREVRAATLAALAPVPGQLLWDVGAGAGSVAIEWLRAHRGNRAVAIERKPERAARIAANASALGTPLLRVAAGAAPAALDDLEAPDAVFVGGGLSDVAILQTCWSALKPRGRLVANAVTLEGEQALMEWRRKNGGALTRIAVSRAEPVGPFSGWRPLMPVTQLAAVKG